MDKSEKEEIQEELMGMKTKLIHFRVFLKENPEHIIFEIKPMEPEETYKNIFVFCFEASLKYSENEYSSMNCEQA